MNEIDLLRDLAVQARGEADPAIDISTRVRQRLRACRVRPIDRKLAAASLGACALAAVTLCTVLWWPSGGDAAAAVSELAVSGGEPELLLRLLEP